MPWTIERLGFEAHDRRLLASMERLGPDFVLACLGDVGFEAVAAWQKHIDQGRSAKHSFPKLSPSYEKWKEKNYPGKPILELTGSMRGSFYKKELVQRPHVYVLDVGTRGVDPKGVSNAAKAVWHVEGTTRMPRRDFASMPKGWWSRALRNAFMRRYFGGGSGRRSSTWA